MHATNPCYTPLYRLYCLIFTRARPNNCRCRYADIYIPKLTLLSPSSKQVLLLNLSKTEVLRHNELNRMLDIAVAFAAATRALVAEMHTKGNTPYGNRPVGTAKRPINTTWQASTAVVRFTLHNTLRLWRSVSPSAATSVCATGIYECSRHAGELFTRKATVPK